MTERPGLARVEAVVVTFSSCSSLLPGRYVHYVTDPSPAHGRMLIGNIHADQHASILNLLRKKFVIYHIFHSWTRLMTRVEAEMCRDCKCYRTYLAEK